jgi:hypothetical protein
MADLLDLLFELLGFGVEETEEKRSWLYHSLRVAALLAFVGWLAWMWRTWGMWPVLVTLQIGALCIWLAWRVDRPTLKQLLTGDIPDHVKPLTLKEILTGKRDDHEAPAKEAMEALRTFNTALGKAPESDTDRYTVVARQEGFFWVRNLRTCKVVAVYDRHERAVEVCRTLNAGGRPAALLKKRLQPED